MLQNQQKTSRTISTKVYGSDKVGLVGFGENAWIIALPAEPHAAWLQARTRDLKFKADGKGTNLTAAIRVGTEMLKKTPKGILRRMWLLTDGEANRETHRLKDAVRDARAAYVNINCIGFGDSFDSEQLKDISSATHNGKVFEISTLRELTNVLIANAKPQSSLNKQHHHHRAETTVFCIDLSASMQESMDGKRKIEIVQEALDRLLLYKQQVFA